MRRAALWTLLLIAAGARLHLQMAAMPPYAGLDETYHVARLAFTLQENRSPTMREASIPPYLQASIAGRPDALPTFGPLGPAWPALVASGQPLLPDHVLSPSDLRPYRGANYEAQQPSLYYAIVAPAARLLPERTPLNELRVWRAASALFALATVVIVAVIATRIAGPAGLLAAALLASLPTWLTLVVRASNDALACLFIAAALAVTLRNPQQRAGHVAEGVLWAAAFATKLYAWPVAVVLPFAWRIQRASRARIFVVILIGTIGVAATVADLASRTNNPLGLFAFDPPQSSARPVVPIAYDQMVRTFLASFAWTSAQHFNALRPIGIALYAIPVLALVAFVWVRHWRSYRPLLAMCFLATAAFALAQIVNAAGYIRTARAAGVALPAGGKEGWYWYTLAPLGIAALAVVIRHAPKPAAIALVIWLAAWDVLIQEGAQMQDFAGRTRAGAGDRIVAWGPRALPFTEDLRLERMSAGPGVSILTIDRLVHVSALMALLAAVLRAGTRPAPRDA
ncbi:MAG TPA: hypothetical protein VFT12_09770 [Thermoanaerobaculia bacterium]|nr:hypothetical protein [Thermoanaerobaculia bacterium]